MRKFRFILTAMAAVAGFSFISCNNDSKDEEIKFNYTIFQKAVDDQISQNKQHDNAILLVAFGSTWQQAFDAFDATVKAYKKAFPQSDIYISFSSAICRNQAAAGEHADEGAEIRQYYAPDFWLHGFGAAKYKEITVQSLQVIPGEEFANVVGDIKDFVNNKFGDLDQNYIDTGVKIKLGRPLLASVDDVNDVAEIIDDLYADSVADGVMAFMGHGNPNDYDTYNANIRYEQLEEALQDLKPGKYYVGTVDAPDNYKVQVLERMNDDNIPNGTKVYLHPLMSIAGDHAHNDMGGDDDAWEDGYEENEEGEVEDTSWKSYFSHYNGFQPQSIMKGLLEISEIRQVWIDHTKDAEYFYEGAEE